MTVDSIFIPSYLQPTPSLSRLNLNAGLNFRRAALLSTLPGGLALAGAGTAGLTALTAKGVLMASAALGGPVALPVSLTLLVVCTGAVFTVNALAIGILWFRHQTNLISELLKKEKEIAGNPTTQKHPYLQIRLQALRKTITTDPTVVVESEKYALWRLKLASLEEVRRLLNQLDGMKEDPTSKAHPALMAQLEALGQKITSDSDVIVGRENISQWKKKLASLGQIRKALAYRDKLEQSLPDQPPLCRRNPQSTKGLNLLKETLHQLRDSLPQGPRSQQKCQENLIQLANCHLTALSFMSRDVALACKDSSFFDEVKDQPAVALFLRFEKAKRQYPNLDRKWALPLVEGCLLVPESEHRPSTIDQAQVFLDQSIVTQVARKRMDHLRKGHALRLSRKRGEKGLLAPGTLSKTHYVLLCKGAVTLLRYQHSEDLLAAGKGPKRKLNQNGQFSKVYPLIDELGYPSFIRRRMESDNVSLIREERQTALNLHDVHPSILTGAVSPEKMKRGKAVQEFIMPHAGKDLATLAKEDPHRFTNKPQAVAEALKAILLPLNAMAQKGYAHLDVKRQNVVWSEKEGYKLIDFGLSKKPKKGIRLPKRGTPAFVGPELCLPESEFNVVHPKGLDGAVALDIYALAMTGWYLLGIEPFTTQTLRQNPIELLLAQVIPSYQSTPPSSQVTYLELEQLGLPSYDQAISQYGELGRLLRDMSHPEPQLRPSHRQIFERLDRVIQTGS